MNHPYTSSGSAKGPPGGMSPPIPQTPSPPDGDGSRVRRALVVGSDEPSLRLCAFVLKNAGFHIDRVDSGIAAVVSARLAHPELIVMGLQLHDVSSREAVSWLRSNPTLEATPIYVLISPQEEAGLSPHSIPLRKPISVETIRRLIGKDHVSGRADGR